MKRHVIVWLLCSVFTFLLVPHAAQAAFSVLSGRLHGTEPKAIPEDPLCYLQFRKPLGYDVVSLTVSESGSYLAASSNWEVGLDPYFAIYSQDFDATRPEVNRLAQQDIESWWGDTPVEVYLEQGVQYLLVTAPYCAQEVGTWTVVFSGPGNVTSDNTIDGLDSFLEGTFGASSNGASANTADIGCGAGEYHASGPQQVSRGSKYYLVDISRFMTIGACVGVYDRPFDRANPALGRIALLNSNQSYYSAVHLKTGQVYYFVATPPNPGQQGDYMYLVLPTEDAYIDPVLSGAWYNPATPGQGFFLDMHSSVDQVFLGWFTFDLQREALAESPLLGDAGHRWVTAYGPARDTDAVMQITVTTGGIFDEAIPGVENRTDGTLRLHFFDCQSGEIRYDLGSAGRTGVIPIQRISSAAAQPCYDLVSLAGKPRGLMAN